MKAIAAFSAFAAAIALFFVAVYALTFPRQAASDKDILAAAAFVAIAIGITAVLTAALWPIWKGGWSGAIITFLAYPIVSFVSFSGNRIIETGPGYSLGTYISAYLIYTVLCFAFTGWITVPAGALLGRWLASRESSTTGGTPTATPSAPSQTHGYTSNAPYPASRR